jgi:hypothetical protein
MACIGRCITGNILNWESIFNDVLSAHQNEPGCLGYLFPAEGEPGWGIRNIYIEPRRGELDLEAVRRPRQYQVLADHISRDAIWEKVKIAALVIGGVTVSLAFALSMVIVALAVAELTGSLFLGLAIVFGELIGESMILSTVILLSALLALGFELTNAFAAVAAGVAAIWTKEILPNVQRGVGYVNHLEAEARDLEYRAASDRASAPVQLALGLPEEQARAPARGQPASQPPEAKE